MRRTLVWIALFVALCPFSRAEDGAPLVLKNRHLALTFDRQTGGWISLVDRSTHDELIEQPAPRALMLPSANPKLDPERIRQALDTGAAIDLDGEWLYTPTPPGDAGTAALIQGRFEACPWQPTPVPSRRGAGDDRLHDRSGDFYYRRTFRVPDTWPEDDRMLVIGAVDDFDATYLNGTQIGATGVETPQHWQVPRYYRVPAGLLRKGQPNVLLIKVTNIGFDGGIDGPLVLGLASALSPSQTAGAPLTEAALTRHGQAQILLMVSATPPFEYRVECFLPDDQAGFTRRITVRNISAKETILQNQPSYATPPLLIGKQQSVIFPGSLPVGDQAVATLSEGVAVSPRTLDPLVIVWDAATGRGLGSWFHCEQEYAPVSARRAGAGVQFRHAQQIVTRLKPGQTVTLGTQFFWLSHGGRDEALRGVQIVYHAIGLKAPEHGLSELRQKVMYNGHPGGVPEKGFRGYGGFKALDAYVPTLEKMGVDLVWLLPIWEHGDGRKWNLYSPFDQFRVSPLYGTPDELKQLSASCRGRGMRLMFDLVPHGPPDFTPLAREHPEWICLDAEGKRVFAWGQYAFDNNHPGWQAYMRRAAAWGAREFGAIGSRVDCGAGGPLNWSRAVGDRPSLSSLAAGLGMNRAIREGYLEVQPEVVVLPEEYTGANIFYRVSDLTYDAQFYFLQADLHARKASPEEWAEKIARFLHDQQLTLPEGALKMRWISNHDTVMWTLQKARPIKLYGVEKTRALLALCAFIEGVPMLYQGDEDPSLYGGRGPSSVDALAKFYHLRKRLPSLRDGSADYATVHASGGVFACLRARSDSQAVVLVSLNPQGIETELSPSSLLSGTWTDELSGEMLNLHAKPRLSMAPFQVRVLTRSTASTN